MLCPNLLINLLWLRQLLVWTDCTVKLLINAAHKHEAYKKTSMKMDQK